MNFWKNIFGNKNVTEKHLERIRITSDNISNWPKIDATFQSGQTKFDSKKRLRYLHGAPVGDFIIVDITKDGKPIYKESTEEWFDPESQKAKDFIWP
jgi:hypothetical protein